MLMRPPGGYLRLPWPGATFTKRLSHGWQGSADIHPRGFSLETSLSARRSAGLAARRIELAPDLGGESPMAARVQRHRAVFNGIWDIGYGFQLSGLYFFGSGVRFTTNYGGDMPRISSTVRPPPRPTARSFDGTTWSARPMHRVDLRLQKRFGAWWEQPIIDGIVEAFNLVNHRNYGSDTTQESNARYGQPSDNTNQAYQSRRLQLGFRFAF